MQLILFDEGTKAMWTKASRGKYNRDGLRYPSDLMAAEWELVELLIPSAKLGGRRREVDVREVLNDRLYVLSTGCQWRAAGIFVSTPTH